MEPGAPGKRTLTQHLQRRARGGAHGEDPAETQEIADAGTSGAGAPLPFLDQIQRSFGRHDVTGARAHTGAEAGEAARAIGAEAYATGDQIAFAGSPSLHTAAHEAAHVVQQRAGVHLKDGVGEVGDTYEQHADAVADRVVRGESAEDLLDRFGGLGGGAGGGGRVQKRAYLGPSFTAPSATDLAKPGVQGLHDDATIRRFKDGAELASFAAAGRLENMGSMADGTWIRLDGPMIVLGEDHGAPLAPDIITATGTRKFRYEGFSHHSATRLEKSDELSDHVEAEATDRLTQKGIAVADGEEDQTHEAEHALPKYARTLPDVKQMADLQQAGGPGAVVGDKSVVAGAALGAEYSLAKSLLKALATSLLYAKSYGEKFWGHSLKAFYNANRAAVDAGIVAMNAAVGTSTVPDFAALAITGQLDALTTAYETAAKAKVGLKSAKDIKNFKKKLNLVDEPDVAMTARSKENDYLRDASMIKTIKDAKGAGDKLFVIGDAHRHKLEPLVRAEGLPVMRDTDWVADQKRLNGDAAAQVMPADRSTLATSKEKAKGFMARPSPRIIGDTFMLPAVDDMPHCAWVVEAADPTGTPNQYTVTARNVKAKCVWTMGAVAETLKELTFTCKPR
jgi:hypothetical protein